ncbi:hypothetical protein ABZT06_49895 [Streptomyces sp. NPDC005483]|uniref:hypothetical protein n=1 Tax=Streptomyces sp. NPDC005483 TaxID=3154882 RepID=UPI00339E73CA
MTRPLSSHSDGGLQAVSTPPAARLDVYMAEDGSTVVNGYLLAMPSDRTSSEAMLDALVMFARSLQAPVIATVIDRVVQQVSRLRVYPDGMSRPLADDEDLPPGPERTAAEEHVFPPLARAERIVQHARRKELHTAFVLSSALREHLTLRRGVEDEFSLEAHALEAYLAYLRGDYALSTSLALTVARVRCSTSLHRAAPEVARATATWQRLTDDGQVAVRGKELLHMWERLSEEGLLSEPSHQAMAQVVRRRLGTKVRPQPDLSTDPDSAAGREPVAVRDEPRASTRGALWRVTHPGRSAR